MTEAPQGLEVAMKERFDLIVLDVMLPIINGFNMCPASQIAGRASSDSHHTFDFAHRKTIARSVKRSAPTRILPSRLTRSSSWKPSGSSSARAPRSLNKTGVMHKTAQT